MIKGNFIRIPVEEAANGDIVILKARFIESASLLNDCNIGDDQVVVVFHDDYPSVIVAKSAVQEVHRPVPDYKVGDIVYNTNRDQVWDEGEVMGVHGAALWISSGRYHWTTTNDKVLPKRK